MAVNIHSTVQALIEHRQVFFQMMDRRIARREDDSVFVQSEYNVLLRDATLGQPDRAQRIYQALAIENLDRCGLTLFWDSRNGRFGLIGWLMEMLRHFDSRRQTGLTSAELDDLYGRIINARNQVRSAGHGWSVGDPDHVEMTQLISTVLRDATSTLKQSIRALEGSAQILGDIVDAKDFTALDKATKTQRALKEIQRIYNRHVIPTLQFLDPRITFKRPGVLAAEVDDGHTAPMALIQDIVDTYESHGEIEVAREFRRMQVEMGRMSGDVSIIRNQLELYLKYLDSQRKVHDRIKARYEALLSAVTERQDGRLRSRTLQPGHPVFASARFLDGLKSRSMTSTALIDWPLVPGRTYLDEHLRLRLKAQEEAPAEQPPTLRQSNRVDSARIDSERQLAEVCAAMKDFVTPSECSDIQDAIHCFLTDVCPGYQLPNLLDAMSFVEQPVHAVPVFNAQTIIFGPYVLTYYPIGWTADRHEEASA